MRKEDYAISYNLKLFNRYARDRGIIGKRMDREIRYTYLYLDEINSSHKNDQNAVKGEILGLSVNVFHVFAWQIFIIFDLNPKNYQVTLEKIKNNGLLEMSK